MPKEHAENIEDLLMGNISENISESDEVFQDRLRQATAKLQQLQKDESRSHVFDKHLAKIILQLNTEQLNFVIFLINYEISSLTILAILSIVNDASFTICEKEFVQYIEEHANFSLAKFNNPEFTKRVNLWWTFVVGAEILSTTVKLRSYRDNEDFITILSQGVGDLLRAEIQRLGMKDFDNKILEKLLRDYRQEIMADHPANLHPHA